MRGYKSNHNVAYSSKCHVVWCPKYRRKVLVDKVAERPFNLIPKAALRYRAEVLALEIIPDHVPLLVEVDPQFGIPRLVKTHPSRRRHVARPQKTVPESQDTAA